jgi:hypothetical protein
MLLRLINTSTNLTSRKIKADDNVLDLFLEEDASEKKK